MGKSCHGGPRSHTKRVYFLVNGQPMAYQRSLGGRVVQLSACLQKRILRKMTMIMRTSRSLNRNQRRKRKQRPNPRSVPVGEHPSLCLRVEGPCTPRTTTTHRTKKCQLLGLNLIWNCYIFYGCPQHNLSHRSSVFPN